MFGSIWIFGMMWGLMKKKPRMLPAWGLVILILPMAVDGSTHLVSDLYGIGKGFRDSNAWLVVLTNHAFSAAFYSGDAWGSFNAWMRLITGVLFGLGIVWYGFHFIDEAFSSSRQVIENKYHYQYLMRVEKERLAALVLNSAERSEESNAILHHLQGKDR